MKITIWKWLVENGKSMDEGRRTGAKAEISEELMADCILHHSFLQSLTHSLTHLLIQIIFCGDFHGSRQSEGSAREKEEERESERINRTHTMMKVGKFLPPLRCS